MGHGRSIERERPFLSRYEKLKKCAAMIGAAALLGSGALAQNWNEVQKFTPFRGETNEIPVLHGCEVDTENRLLPPNDVRSSARDFEPTGVNPFDTLKTINTFFDYPQSSFVSDYSGIRFTFYSDQADAGWSIDHAAFDEIFHYPLVEHEAISHEGARDIKKCLHERIVIQNEFAETDFSVYIPSNPNSCIGNGRIIDLQERPNAACKQRGFAPPHINIKIGPFTLFEGNIMVLTGGRNDDTRQESMKRLAHHESIHAHAALAGEPTFRLDDNEKWAVYIQNEVLNMTNDRFNSMASFISYPE